MILHLLIVDDEEDVLESLVPGFVGEFTRRLMADAAFQKANDSAGQPFPKRGRLNVKITNHNYNSVRVPKYAYQRPVHLHLHLVCEKNGSFRHALRLLKEHFFAVAVSDLRFSDDVIGARAGKLFIEDVQRRNPETFSLLYSAYQRPDGYPADRFVRKGATSNLGGEELIDKMVEGVGSFLRTPAIQRFSKELTQRGLVYESDVFGSMLRRLYDYGGLYFGYDSHPEPGRRRPRPTLLLDGETGVGKTELAGLLHQASERREQPFVSASCGQLADEHLLRSSLFGHVKGAFSGATADRPGLIQTASKGILLLDDLHKLTEGASVILHSFLDDGEYSHVGQDEIRRHAEAGIVVAVETPRWEQIKAGSTLSESFVHRVEQLVIRIPPLRQRPEDIERQAVHYCATLAKQLGGEIELAPEAIAWLVEYGFPNGNSRKLRDFLKGLVSANLRVTDYLGIPEMEEYAAEIGPMSGTPMQVPMQVAASRSSTLLRDAGVSVQPQPRAIPPSPTDEIPVETTIQREQPILETVVNGPPWLTSLEAGSWQARVAELATSALMDEAKLSHDIAERTVKRLFEDLLPKYWELLQQIAGIAANETLEIRVVDELLRCYAVYRCGTPAKAAKELRMKDNALREFIYSREQKRKSD